jgi:thiosulfate dehydrogenase
MRWNACRYLLLGPVLLAIFLWAKNPAAQETVDDTELGPVFLLSLGGKLYDDLWLVLDRPRPERRNPAVPADARVSDESTWRCVTCHGWSYSGAEVGGAIFPGLRELAGEDPAVIADRIRDPEHPFPAGEIPELGLQVLSAFIRDGLYDRADFVDANGAAIGNPEFGRDIFEGACISCHQLDGRRYLRGEQGDRSSLGWVARNRPEQALHKILNGVPAAEMLALRFFSGDGIADLLAYLQTLDLAEQ